MHLARKRVRFACKRVQLRAKCAFCVQTRAIAVVFKRLLKLIYHPQKYVQTLIHASYLHVKNTKKYRRKFWNEDARESAQNLFKVLTTDHKLHKINQLTFGCPYNMFKGFLSKIYY